MDRLRWFPSRCWMVQPVHRHHHRRRHHRHHCRNMPPAVNANVRRAHWPGKSGTIVICTRRCKHIIRIWVFPDRLWLSWTVWWAMFLRKLSPNLRNWANCPHAHVRRLRNVTLWSAPNCFWMGIWSDMRWAKVSRLLRTSMSHSSTNQNHRQLYNLTSNCILAILVMFCDDITTNKI